MWCVHVSWVGIPQATGVVGFLVLGDQAGGNRNHNDGQTKLAVDSREITEARDGQKKHDLRPWRSLLAKKTHFTKNEDTGSFRRMRDFATDSKTQFVINH